MGESKKLPTWRIQKNYKRIRGGARLIREENIKQCQKSSVKVTKSGYNVKPLFKNSKPIKLCTSLEKISELQSEFLFVSEKSDSQNSFGNYSDLTSIATPEKPITPVTPSNEGYFQKAEENNFAQPTLSDYDRFFYGDDFLIENHGITFDSFNSIPTPTEIASFPNSAAILSSESYVPTILIGSSDSDNELENLIINHPLFMNH